MLAWGALGEGVLLWLCAIDDTSVPHDCPSAIWPLVVLGIATVVVAAAVAWISVSVRAVEVAAAFLAALVLLAALGFALGSR